MTDRGNRAAGRLTGVALAVLIVLAVVTAMGAQNQNTPDEIPDPDDTWVTDTTTPIPEADYDYSTEDGIWITDTTLALAPDPEPVPDSATAEETPPHPPLWGRPPRPPPLSPGLTVPTGTTDCPPTRTSSKRTNAPLHTD